MKELDLRTNAEWLGYLIHRSDQANQLERKITRWRVATVIAVGGQLALLALLAIV